MAEEPVTAKDALMGSVFALGFMSALIGVVALTWDFFTGGVGLSADAPLFLGLIAGGVLILGPFFWYLLRLKPRKN